MVSVLIWLLVIVSGINLFRYVWKAGTPINRDPTVHYERELKRLERRKKLAVVVIGCLAILGILAVIFLDWL